MVFFSNLYPEKGIGMFSSYPQQMNVFIRHILLGPHAIDTDNYVNTFVKSY